MPFVLVIVGTLFIIVGYRGTQSDLLTLLKSDFTGQHNFFYWLVSILVIGAIGYIPKLKGLSDAFLLLVIIVLFLNNKGFFAQFNTQLGSTTTAPAATSTGVLGHV